MLKLSTVFQLLLATLYLLLWNCEHTPLWKPGCSFPLAYTKMSESTYSSSSSKMPLANSYFQRHSRSVTWMSCFLPVLSQDPLWLKTWVEWEKRAQPPSKRLGVPLPQAGHWVSGELSKKAAGVRQMSYPMISAIFTADADVRLLWGHLTKKGDGLWRCRSLLQPCKGIRTFDSKPSSWITVYLFPNHLLSYISLHTFS